MATVHASSWGNVEVAGSPVGACSSQTVTLWGDFELWEPVISCLPVEEQLKCVYRLSCIARDSFACLDLSNHGSPLWRMFVQSLCSQRNLWVPEIVRGGTALVGAGDSWRELFEDLWPLRNRFSVTGTMGTEAAAKTSKLRITTFCRFRPTCERRAAVQLAASRSAVTGVTLPLHQRVALLRRSHPELSQKEAVSQVIAVHRAQREQQLTAECIGEVGHGGGMRSSVVSVQSGAKGSVLAVSPGCGLRGFEFGHVFDGGARQDEVYDQCGLKLVMDLANGVNGALIMYGQTGAGKTHTMFGPPDAAQDQRGLAARITEAVVAAAAERRTLGLDVQMRLSYVEVFGNQVTDLLTRALASNEPSEARRVLNGNMERVVESAADIERALADGNERKRCAETAMNNRSTRAHTLLVFRLQQRQFGSVEPPISSQLILADLGGSERVRKSGANEGAKSAGFGTWTEYYESRQRITETNNINQGLLALKRCIQALDERQRTGRAIPVPYRDSRLTELLEPALGGLARTSIVVCCNSEATHAEETVQTLRFGEMCSAIEHVRAHRADATAGVALALQQLDEQIADVERRIREKERWEWRDIVRTDIVDANDESTVRVNEAEEMELGGLGAVEILPDDGTNVDRREVQHTVRGEVLVGAEAEREELEALLDRRRQLLGEA